MSKRILFVGGTTGGGVATINNEVTRLFRSAGHRCFQVDTEKFKARFPVPVAYVLAYALTVVRMLDLIADLEKNFPQTGAARSNAKARYIANKEEHAEKVKAEVRVIWGDYFKAPQFEKFPQTHAVVHKIMQLGSKSRQTVERQNGLDLVEAVNEFAQIFWDSKGIKTHRAKAPYAPGLELVYPDL